MGPSLVPREAGTRAGYNFAGGNERATVVRPAGNGVGAAREDRACPGRVAGRTRGACRSRGRGMFSHDPATGEFALALEGARAPRRRNARATRPTLTVSLGDAFLLDSFLRPGGLMAHTDACGHAEPDTALAPPAPCVPAGLANRRARGPVGARLRGAPPPRGQDGLPGSGECLADLGDEDAKRRFVGDRLRLVGRRGMAAADGGAGDLPMDPAGLPNSCHLPAAAVSDHNGEASEEREAATSARPGACGTTGHRGQSPERGSVSSMPSCAIASPTRSPRRIPMSRAPIDKIRNSQFEPVTKTIRTPPEVTSLAQAASPRMAVAHEHGRLPTR